MKILALDIAEYRTGWALGSAGEKPEVGVQAIRTKAMTTEDAVAAFAEWVDVMLPVDLCVAEKYLPHGAIKLTTADTRDGAILMHGALRGVCALRNVAVRCPHVLTIRKHFTGNGRSDKDMVLRQAQMLGYLPKDCMDYDKSDAVALFDFASSHFANKAAAFQLA